jgi:hypothetical protein
MGKGLDELSGFSSTAKEMGSKPTPFILPSSLAIDPGILF